MVFSHITMQRLPSVVTTNNIQSAGVQDLVDVLLGRKRYALYLYISLKLYGEVPHHSSLLQNTLMWISITLMWVYFTLIFNHHLSGTLGWGEPCIII